MALQSVRVWQTLDLAKVQEGLMVIEDLYGACGKCKQLGLNYTKDRRCPACGAEFKYLATRLTDPAEVIKILKRIQADSLPLQLIDRADLERAGAHDAARALFGG
ncbi:MAG: hypothetical protein K1X75_00650 [Leptospirales bacterium]|nr:hypothetical protein [Leptospirales bacterium]